MSPNKFVLSQIMFITQMLDQMKLDEFFNLKIPYIRSVFRKLLEIMKSEQFDSYSLNLLKKQLIKH